MTNVPDLISTVVGEENYDRMRPAESALYAMKSAAVAPLLSAMSSRTGKFRYRIPNIVTKIATESLDDSLLTQLKDALMARVQDPSDDAELRGEAVRVLGYVLEDKRAIPLFHKALQDQFPVVRRFSAGALGRSARTMDEPMLASVARQLIVCLGDKDGTVRRYAADALGEVCLRLDDAELKTAAGAALLAMLDDSEKTAAADAATALAKTGVSGPQVVQGLIRPLSSSHRDLRMNAVQSLGAILSKPDQPDSLRQTAIPYLMKMLKDFDYGVRSAAAEALGALRVSEAINSLIALLKDEDWPVRKSAVRALGQIGNQRALLAIRAQAGDSSGVVRDAVAEVLKSFQSD